MSEFQRRDVEGRPLDEQVDNEPARVPPTSLELEDMPQDLTGAVMAEGAEEVREAIDQLAQGRARPQELMEWIDDIRETEAVRTEITDEATRDGGLLDEFQPDSVYAGGEVDAPPAPVDDVTRETAAAFGIDDDVDLMFPGRKKKKADGDEEEDDGDGTGTEAPAKSDEKSKKS